MTHFFRCCRFILLLAIAGSFAHPAFSQISDVKVEVQPEHLGLQGIVRPGSWTPMLITLENFSATPKKVRCQWVIPDIDGDPTHFERVVTLTPQRKQQTWLYAMVPFNTPTDRSPDWRLLIIDDATGKLLDHRILVVRTLLPPKDNMIGMTTSGALGLPRYGENLTQHEKTQFIRGIPPELIPDQWYGLAGLQAFIWTPDSKDPASPDVSRESIAALREWVRRGGHLIVMLPMIGSDVWLQSPLAELLPKAEMEIVRAAKLESLPSLGNLLAGEFDMYVFKPDPKVTVVARTIENKPWIIADQRGFGRVTLIGVDLSSRGLVRQGLPAGNSDIWNLIFGWRSKSTRTYQDAAQLNNKMEDGREIGLFVAPQIAMREAFGGALMLAIFIFLAYWLAAGPMGFAVLKFKGKAQHAWVAFVAMVLLFSSICWGGALLLRPGHTRVSHVSMLDIDASTGLVHSHSWLSLFVARHGEVSVAIDPGPEQKSRDTLASPGLPLSEMASTFVDPRAYVVDVAAPRALNPPWRSTAKQFESDFLGKLHETPRDDSPAWVVPQTRMLKLDSDGALSGQISHGLPGKLTDVHVILCEGEGSEPQIWKIGDWSPRQVLELKRPPANEVHPLGRRLPVSADAVEPWGGWLADRIKANSGAERFMKDPTGQQSTAKPAANELVTFCEILSFYTMLPPPEWWNKDWNKQTLHYYRSLGRQMDITALLKLRRLIIIGYLENSPIPAPLAVDGELVRGEGWTAVRWICPL